MPGIKQNNSQLHRTKGKRSAQYTGVGSEVSWPWGKSAIAAANQMVDSYLANNGYKKAEQAGKLPAAAAAYNFGVAKKVKSSISLSANAQKITDMGNSCSGFRLTGSDLLAVTVANDAVHAYNWLYDGTSYYNTFAVIPSDVSPRLKLFDEMFAYYAFRRLKLTYIPGVGTSTTGTLAMSLIPSVDMTLTAGTGDCGSIQKVIEYEHSGVTPLWSETCVDYKFNGVKLFATHSQASGNALQADTYTQLSIGGCLSGAAASATIFGYLYAEYVVDYYGPTPVDSTTVELRLNKTPSQINSAIAFLQTQLSEEEMKNRHLIKINFNKQTVCIEEDSKGYVPHYSPPVASGGVVNDVSVEAPPPLVRQKADPVEVELSTCPAVVSSAVTSIIGTRTNPSALNANAKEFKPSYFK